MKLVATSRRRGLFENTQYRGGKGGEGENKKKSNNCFTPPGGRALREERHPIPSAEPQASQDIACTVPWSRPWPWHLYLRERRECVSLGTKRVRGQQRTFKDADCSREVIDTTSSPQGSGEDLNGGDEIVGKAVVEISLHFASKEQISRLNLYRLNVSWKSAQW